MSYPDRAARYEYRTQINDDSTMSDSAHDRTSTVASVASTASPPVDSTSPPASQLLSNASIQRIHVASVWIDETCTSITSPLISSTPPAHSTCAIDSSGDVMHVASNACCDTSSRTYLYLCSFILLVGWVLNNIGWIYVSMYFGQTYGYWSDQATAVLFIAMQAPVVLYRIYGSKSITKEMRATVHWRVYATMGLLDALYNLLTTMSSPYTSGPVSSASMHSMRPCDVRTLLLINCPD
jgi:hypothetical protein